MTNKFTNTLSKVSNILDSPPQIKQTHDNKENPYFADCNASPALATASINSLKTKIQRAMSSSQRRPSSTFLSELSFQPDNISKSRKESIDVSNEKIENLSQADIKMLYKEISTLKKKLNESQSRAILATKELSKVQYENTHLQLQAKQAESKCKDMIEKHATNQIKVNELTFINNQLKIELAKLKMGAHENSNETKEELQRLKSNLIQIEDVIKMKNDKVTKYAKALQKIVETFQNLFEGLNSSIYSKIQLSFDGANSLKRKARKLTTKIVKVIEIKNPMEYDRIKEGDEEYDAIRSLNQIICAYDKENKELMSEVARLTDMIHKEKPEHQRLIPQYKESLHKLRETVNGVKMKLKDIQNCKQVEKEYYEGKLKKLKETKDKLTQDNKELRGLNDTLEFKLKNKDMEIQVMKEKIQDLDQRHNQGLKSYDLPWTKILQKNEKRNGDNVIFARKTCSQPGNIYGEQTDLTEREDIIPLKEFIGGISERGQKGARGYSADRWQRDSTGNRPRSWRGARDQGEIEQEDDSPAYINSARMKEGITARNSFKGLKTEIGLLDDEIQQLEDCLRNELPTDEDLIS